MQRTSPRSDAPRLLITGANRGIGLEFVKQFHARNDIVLATCRNPGNAVDLQLLSAENEGRFTVLRLDVTDRESIESAARSVMEHTGGLDILINNAGVSPRGERHYNLDGDSMLQVFQVNAVGPMIVSQMFLDLLRQGNNPKIVNITSQMGSITSKQDGGHYSYSGSKAALNMLTRLLSFDVESDGIVVVALHPGWVQTDMGGEHAKLTPQESVRGLIDVISRLTMDDSGKFYTWEGRELPW